MHILVPELQTTRILPWVPTSYKPFQFEFWISSAELLLTVGIFSQSCVFGFVNSLQIVCCYSLWSPQEIDGSIYYCSHYTHGKNVTLWTPPGPAHPEPWTAPGQPQTWPLLTDIFSVLVDGQFIRNYGNNLFRMVRDTFRGGLKTLKLICS